MKPYPIFWFVLFRCLHHIVLQKIWASRWNNISKYLRGRPFDKTYQSSIHTVLVLTFQKSGSPQNSHFWRSGFHIFQRVQDFLASTVIMTLCQNRSASEIDQGTVKKQWVVQVRQSPKLTSPIWLECLSGIQTQINTMVIVSNSMIQFNDFHWISWWSLMIISRDYHVGRRSHRRPFQNSMRSNWMIWPELHHCDWMGEYVAPQKMSNHIYNPKLHIEHQHWWFVNRFSCFKGRNFQIPLVFEAAFFFIPTPPPQTCHNCRDPDAGRLRSVAGVGDGLPNDMVLRRLINDQ